jgi:hypothetical protein
MPPIDWSEVEPGRHGSAQRLLLPSPTTVCQVHHDHRPFPLLLEVHHILPLAMGGKNELANKVIVCPTGHYNIHRLMHNLLDDPTAELRGVVKERRLAVRGMDEWNAAGRPGKFAYTA